MIDEKKLIEELEQMPYIHGRYDHEHADHNFILGVESWHEIVMNQINEQPKLGEWIPCSERLPEDDRCVLVTLVYTYESDYKDYDIARCIHFENGECHWCAEKHGYLEWDKYSDGRGGCSLYKVIAWQPLPEPYKGGEE